MSRRPRRLFGPRPRQGSVMVGAAFVIAILVLSAVWVAALFVQRPIERAWQTNYSIPLW